MDFTKEQAIQELNAHYAGNAEKIDVTRTITEAVENGFKYFEKSDITLEQFVEYQKSNINSSLGLVRHQSANVAKTLQAELETMKKAKEELEAKLKGQNDPNPNPNQPAEDPRIVELQAQMKKLLGDAEAAKEAQHVSEIRNQIKANLLAKGVKKSDAVDDVLGMVAITKDTDVNAMTESVLKTLNKLMANVDPSPSPNMGGGGVDEDKALKESISVVSEMMKKKHQATIVK